MNQIEKVARGGMALCQNALGGKQCPCAESGVFKCADEFPGQQAKAAIAAMQLAPQEPVAWMYGRDDGSRDLLLDCNGEYARNLLELGATETPLYAHPPAQWQGIESAPDLERVIVAGWNPHSGNVRGYWWYGEDVVSNGRAIEHPRATHWRPFNNPAYPTPPAGGSDAE